MPEREHKNKARLRVVDEIRLHYAILELLVEHLKLQNDGERHALGVGAVGEKLAELYIRKYPNKRKQLPGMQQIKMGAWLHDIGKNGHLEIFNSSAKFDERMRSKAKFHPEIGAELVAQDRLMDKKVVKAIKHHHEHWNGDGYPSRMKGDKIPLLARIYALADVWDALRNRGDRIGKPTKLTNTYKTRWTDNDVIRFISAEAGIQFDPELVKILLSNYNEIAGVYEQAVQQGSGEEGRTGSSPISDK